MEPKFYYTTCPSCEHEHKIVEVQGRLYSMTEQNVMRHVRFHVDRMLNRLERQMEFERREKDGTAPDLPVSAEPEPGGVSD